MMDLIKERKGLVLIAVVLVAVVCFMIGVHNTGATVYQPIAGGTTVYKNSTAAIDATNADQGYIMVKYSGSNQKVKMIIQKSGGTSYTYNIAKRGEYETFPLSEGAGSYQVNLYENAGGSRYTTLYGATVKANMQNDYTTFLYPNQFSNFNKDSAVVSAAASITAGCTDDLSKVKAVYENIVNSFKYDKAKAASVQSGYIPNPDAVYASKTGICFDYASVMVAMLRSQGIPTKLVVGYMGQQYHAWISVYTPETGWVESVIYFDGANWSMMDPTFASSSAAKQNFKAEMTKYSTKFVY